MIKLINCENLNTKKTRDSNTVATLIEILIKA